MSQERVERAREAYDALGLAARNGEFDAFFRAYVHPPPAMIAALAAQGLTPRSHHHGIVWDVVGLER